MLALPALAALLCAPILARSPQDDRPEWPGVRAHHWLVYDGTRKSVLLCGGSTPVEDDFVFYDDIWSFDGRAWERIGELARPESGLRVASRPGGGLVAFGGFRGNDDTVGELREWVDGTWRTLDAASDKATAESGFVLDVARGRFVLFGGGSPAGPRGATWEWDGAAWHAFDVPAPAPRSTHGMVYDQRRGKTVLFGGTSGARLGDTWEWDGSAWSEVSGPGPAARIAPAMSYDAKRERTVLFGGRRAWPDDLADTWVFDGASWEEVPGP